MRNKKFIYKEEYVVRFTYFNKETKFWINNQKESVMIPIEKGMREKCNHQLAEDFIMEKYKDNQVRVNRVDYV